MPASLRSFIGAQIIGVADVLAEHALVIQHHPERYDGKGYPDGLPGEDTPLASRILTVADTYDFRILFSGPAWFESP